MNTNVSAYPTDSMIKFSDIAEKCGLTAKERNQFEDMCRSDQDSRDIM